jgi:phage shock protein PspC (stress-responsive transcriptional regulator)
MRIFRSNNQRVIAGVCAGIALSRGWSVALVRLIALALLASGFAFLMYLIFWVCLPTYKKAGIAEPEYLPSDPIKRSHSDRYIAGVCGGLAQYLEVDSAMVRVVFLVLFVFGGIGLLPYFYAWLALPLENSKAVAA